MDASGKYRANTRAVSKPVEARTARSEDEVPPAPVADVIPLVRPPGRPRGHPKTGGRKPGSKNKRTMEVMEALRPLVPKAKRKLKALMDAQDEKVAFSACMGVLSYVFGRPVDRKEIAGAGGAPLHPPEYSDREWARRIAFILRRGDVEGRSEVMATEGSAGTAHVPGSSGGEDTSLGSTTRVQASAPSPNRNRSNGAQKGGGGPLSDRGASESHQHPVSGFEKFSPKKAIPPTEPVEGQTARVAGYIVLCGPPQRPGLPLSYRITDSDGKLLAMATDGWQGALKWVQSRAGHDADMSIDIIRPALTAEPIRPDQRQFAVGGPDIDVLRG